MFALCHQSRLCGHFCHIKTLQLPTSFELIIRTTPTHASTFTTAADHSANNNCIDKPKKTQQLNSVLDCMNKLKKIQPPQPTRPASQASELSRSLALDVLTSPTRFPTQFISNDKSINAFINPSVTPATHDVGFGYKVVRATPISTRPHDKSPRTFTAKLNEYGTEIKSAPRESRGTNRALEREKEGELMQFARKDYNSLSKWEKRRFEVKKVLNGKPWQPQKKLSRNNMDKMRFLHKEMPEMYTPVKLSQEFKVSVEAVVRILHSRFVPNAKQHAKQEANKRAAREARFALNLKNVKSDSNPKPPKTLYGSSNATEIVSISDTVPQRKFFPKYKPESRFTPKPAAKSKTPFKSNSPYKMSLTSKNEPSPKKDPNQLVKDIFNL